MTARDVATLRRVINPRVPSCDADDVVQEAAIGVLRAARLPASGPQRTAFLKVIAERSAVQYWRDRYGRGKVPRVDPDELTEDIELMMDSDAGAVDLRLSIVDALRDSPREHVQALLLTAAGESIVGQARAEGMSEKGIRYRLERAEGKLREAGL